nr:hypothetical protein [Brucella intermedia]
MSLGSIEVTSYAELALTDSDSDAAHPAFAKMFVETEISDNGSTIYAKRRKRAPSDPDIHVAHFVTDLSGSIRETEVKIDRRAFVGRGRSLRDAAAFDGGAKLNGGQGCVLDTIASIRTGDRNSHPCNLTTALMRAETAISMDDKGV